MSETVGAKRAVGDDPLGRAILRQAELIAELRRDLNRLASETTDTLTAFSDRLEDVASDNLEPKESRVVTAWCWRNLGPHGQEALWSELGGWVDWIRSRYPLARKIPDCWREHPEVVEELTALWLAWQGAYAEPDPPLTAASDWHDRWLPGVLHRLEHGPFAVDCVSDHRRRPESAYVREGGMTTRG